MTLAPAVAQEWLSKTCARVQRFREQNDIHCTTPFSPDCFDRSRCGADGKTFSVYVAAWDCRDWLPSTQQLKQWRPNEKNWLVVSWRNAARKMGVLADDPEDACMFLYPLFSTFQKVGDLHLGDLGHQNCIRNSRFWNDGKNWVIAQRADHGIHDQIELFGRAIFATTHTLTCWHRRGVDIGMPLDALPANAAKAAAMRDVPASRRKYLATFKGSLYPHAATATIDMIREFFANPMRMGEDKASDLRWLEHTGNPNGGQRSNLLQLHNGRDIIVVGRCKGAFGKGSAAARWCDCVAQQYDDYEYADLMDSRFALLPGGRGPHSFRMVEAMKSGSIPVFIGDGYEPPYSDRLDWSKMAFRFTVAEIPLIPDTLRAVTPEQADAMQKSVVKACQTILCGSLPVTFTHVYKVLQERLWETAAAGGG